MDLIIRQVLFILGGVMLYLGLKLQSPPRKILKLVNVMMSLVAVCIVFTVANTMKAQEVTATYKVYLSIALLVLSVLALVYRWRIQAISLMSAGMLCNMLAFISNNWTMPVFSGWDAYNKTVGTYAGPLHRVMTHDSHLNILGDLGFAPITIMGYSLMNSFFSIGDVLIATGVFVGSYKLLNMFVENRLQSKNG